LLSWVLVELLGDGTVLHKEYETEGEAQAALWKMLDDAPDQEQRDRLSDVLNVEKSE
jgi:UDP:flavonoid glycosyltransferase YjiC (YdhE family)